MNLDLDDAIIVIFGATGDLTHRKLLPSIFGLYAHQLTPKNFRILGLGRRELDLADFRAKVRKSLVDARDETFKLSKLDLQNQERLIDSFVDRVFYTKCDPYNEPDYHGLKQAIDQHAKELDIKANAMFYMSVPPSAYSQIAYNLKSAGLADQTDGWRRIVIEKPFGYDTESALTLNREIHECLDESQIFRIDHYVGKEAVQNLLVFRFGNSIFEPIWNRKYIDYVEITSAESISVNGRIEYYDNAGALRDMYQNHLMNVLAFTAMEVPVQTDSDSIRDELVKVIKSLKPLTPETIEDNVVLAQYEKSEVEGSQNYLDLHGVKPDSKTETYFQSRVFIDNWRWAGVPFYLRTGKCLKKRIAEIVIHFKKPPMQGFSHADKNGDGANCLVIRIQPDESIKMNFVMKRPGQGFSMVDATMDFEYSDITEADKSLLILDAYQRLLLDCIRGDATLFTRSDFVIECWKFCQPILDYKEGNPKVYKYPVGSWGPENDLLHLDGKTWHLDSE